MSHRIKKVEYVEDYKLRLYFDDKKVKIVDLQNMLKKAKNMLLPLVDIDYFKQVECDGFSIVWPNGVDLCPDVLYRMGKDVAQIRKSGKISRTLKTRRKSKIKL